MVLVYGEALKNMSITRSSIIAVCLGAILSLVPGCSTTSTSEELAKTEGAVEYRNNKLMVNDAIRFSEVLAAANAALEELHIRVLLNNKTHRSARLECLDSQNQEVVVQLFWKSVSVTAIQITVGKTERIQSRLEAEQIYNKMKELYGVIERVKNDQP